MTSKDCGLLSASIGSPTFFNKVTFFNIFSNVKNRFIQFHSGDSWARYNKNFFRSDKKVGDPNSEKKSVIAVITVKNICKKFNVIPISVK